MKVSELINGLYDDRQYAGIRSDQKNDQTNDNIITMPEVIDEKFMEFLLDYVTHVEQNGLPVFNQEKIIAATVLENAVGYKIYELFVKHFKYKFQRSDLAVKQHLAVFGRMLECSTAIIANSLITLFAIAHKIIIQHLPSAEFIMVDE
jgi:hypothetical protein